MDELDTKSALASLDDRPVWLAVGEHDRAIGLEMPRELKRHAKGSELWVMPGANHVEIPEAIADEYGRRLRGFFEATLLRPTAAEEGRRP